jgi:4-amino-4-deoxy-L-arabinose transferase-like glycosyltransferase
MVHSASDGIPGVSHRLSDRLAALPLRYILLAAFVIRLLFALFVFIHGNSYSVFYNSDSAEYAEMAQNWLEKGSDLALGGQPRQPNVYRPPGYPLLLLARLALGHLEFATVGIQIVLSCLTVYLVMAIARFAGAAEPAARLAGVLYAIEPQAILYCPVLLTETLFATLLALFVYCFLRYVRFPSLPWLAMAAGTLAAAPYVRPVGLFLVPVMGIAVYWASRRRRLLDVRSLAHALAFLAICAGLIGLWAWRNKRLAGYSGFSSTVEINLYRVHAASVLAQVNGVAFVKMGETAANERSAYYEAHPEMRESDDLPRMRREALAVLRAHPGTFLLLYLRGIPWTLFAPNVTLYCTFFPPPGLSAGVLTAALYDKDVFGAVKLISRYAPVAIWIGVPATLVLLMYYALATGGLIFGPGLDRRSKILLVAVCAVLVGVAGGTIASGRFRHPIMPMVSVFAAEGLALILNPRSGIRLAYAAGIHRG